MIWFDLLRGALWATGGALILAAASVAHAERRWRALPIDPGFAAGLGLLALAGLVSVRAVWLQGALATVLVIYAGWVCWRRLDRAAAPGVVEPWSAPAPMPRRRSLAGMELLIWLLAAPWLWFPTLRPEVTALAVLLLALGWLAVWAAGGGLWPRSRYDLTLIVLLGVAALGAWQSSFPELTLSKVAGLLLGLALYRLVQRTAERRGALLWALVGLAVLAAGFCLVGLPSGLRPAKVSVLGQVVARLPSFVQDLPETQNGRVSMNQLAGALLYVLPVVLGGVLAPRGAARSERLRPGMRALLVLLALAMAGTLALAQSRAAWLGLAAGLVVMVALRWRWGRWVVLAATLAALGGWLLVGRARLEPLLVDILNAPRGADTALGSLSLRGRVAIWERTIVYVGERPWMGYGLGTYRGVDGDPAAGTLIDAGLPHAHNVFLQVAYDLGLVGLAAYLALLGLAAGSCWRVYRQGDALARSLAAGALAALAAYHVYGLADVVALGAKPGVLWWGLLAWIAALDRLIVPQGESRGTAGAE